ncbi:MAG: hypothetical protein M3256_19215 [Actinomycetota bacterium]|nr:hypothetical protein [Actinomycetota bacterium]
MITTRTGRPASDFPHRRPLALAAALAVAGLALLMWLPVWTATAQGGCKTSPGGTHFGVASVVAGALMIGAAAAAVAGRKTCQIVVVTLAVAIPAAVVGLIAWGAIGFHRCWNF